MRPDSSNTRSVREADNLFDRHIDHWTGAATQRTYEYQLTGRSIIFGARDKL